MVNKAINAVDKIAEKSAYWITTILLVVGGMSWLAKQIAPVAQYGWAADVAAGVVLTSMIIAAVALLLMGWRYFSPISTEQPGSLENAKHKTADAELKFVRTVLRLRFSGEMESPQALYAENILDWFAYWTPSFTMREGSDGNVFFSQPPAWALFVNFKEPSNHHQIVVNFTGSRPKSCEVRRNYTTSTVVTMDGPMLACEMEMINILQPLPPSQA
jgi:hypothetical protein